MCFFRGARACAWGVVALAFSGALERAMAGAWTLGDGEGQIIVSTAFSDSTRAFDAKGRVLPVADWRKFELGFHIEYGINDAITLIANPMIDAVTATGPPAGAFRGIESVELGARARFATWGDAVFSAQALAKIPGSKNLTNPALWGNEAYEAEGRLLAGYSFRLFDVAFFADGEIAWAARNGGNPGEARLDLTLGFRPFEKAQVLLQSFNAETTGKGNFLYPAQRWSKAQPSIVYDFADGWSAQAGLFTTIAAVNARRERGGLLAVWKKF